MQEFVKGILEVLEKDRQYVASMFSNIVALVALVVSLIALVKG